MSFPSVTVQPFEETSPSELAVDVLLGATKSIRDGFLPAARGFRSCPGSANKKAFFLPRSAVQFSRPEWQATLTYLYQHAAYVHFVTKGFLKSREC